MKKFLPFFLSVILIANFAFAQKQLKLNEKTLSFTTPTKEIDETQKRGIPSTKMVWDTKNLTKIDDSYVIKLKSKTGFTCFGIGWKSDKNISANDFKISYKIVKNPRVRQDSKKVWGIFENTEGYLKPSDTETEYYWSDLLFGYDEQSRQELLITLTAPKNVDISEIRIDFMNLSKDINPKHAKNMMPAMATRTCPAQPTIIPRADWCGEYTACTNATYTPTNITPTHTVIHHGASPDTYTDGYAVVRSYWNYHVNTLGWSDIGYNYLIDKYGNLFQGRKNLNCPTQDVQGAHAGASNPYSIGINFLGNADVTTPTTDQLNKLYAFLGWWYDHKGFDPTTSANIVLQSGGSATLPRICGHKDVNVGGTDCPGTTLYSLLSTIRTSTKSVIDACTADLVAPTTSITNPGWKSTTFTANFTDADNTGGSGIKKQFYQVSDFNGTEWRSNNTFGFFNDNFNSAIHTDWTNIAGTWAVSSGVLLQNDEVNSNTNLYAAVNQVSGNTYMYNWKMKISGTGTNRRAGIHFFCDDATQSNRNNSYMVYFRADGNTAQIYEYTANTMYLRAEAACTVSPGTQYDYKVILNSSTGEINAYQNDVLVCSWTDTTPLTVGNQISLRTGNCVVEYDDFRVFKSRTSTASVTVGNGTTYEIRYQNSNPTTPSGKIASFVTDVANNISSEATTTVNVDYWGSYPVATVNDGTSTDISTQTDLTTISANWTAATDVNNTIKAYWYAIGTSSGATNILSWTSASTALSFTNSSLSLSVGTTYYVSVKTENEAGLFSTVKSSDGVLIVNPSVPSVIFTESMGTVSTTTLITTHETANGFDNDAYTMSGTGDVRITTASSGYTGASGSANVYLTTTAGKYFQIEGINTIGYTDLTLKFGMYTNLIGYAVTVEVSSDGVNYSALSVSNSTSATWTLKTAEGTIPATSNLRIRFTQPGTSSQMRIDDIELSGSTQSVAVTGVSISPSTLSLVIGNSGTLVETITPSNATNKSVVWSSSNTSIATVSSAGVVTAIAEGTADITATSVDGNIVSNSCVVTVSAPTISTLVTWNFPDLDDVADGGITANLSSTITSNATGTSTYPTGATTYCISKSGWSDGANTKYWQVSFTTSGYSSITVSSKQKSSDTGPADFKLQYSLDGTNFTDVTGGTISVKNDLFVNGVLNDVALSACGNQSVVYLRWLVTSTTSVGGGTVGSTGTSRIDDIIVKGTQIISKSLMTSKSKEENEISVVKNTSFDIYPNPAKEFINVRINNDDIQNLNIYDMKGKIVLSETIENSKTIDVSNFKKGMYFMRIGKNVNRFIVE